MDMLNPHCGIDRDSRGVVRLVICNAHLSSHSWRWMKASSWLHGASQVFSMAVADPKSFLKPGTLSGQTSKSNSSLLV